ncbi:MAG: helix-turn-helix transcriptional regulator [Eubacteriales bacterium]|nr:helix-turn-helix transcriptional regulator [Eubacteriales bacterium]
MTLGEKIQKLRKACGLSQLQLAEQLNVSRQSISKWELNESVPDINKIIKLSEVFSVSVDETDRCLAG